MYTTCGSAEERAFLLERFAGLDGARIASFGNCVAFVGMVKRGTGGEGVDLVLHTGEASMQVSTILGMSYLCHICMYGEGAFIPAHVGLRPPRCWPPQNTPGHTNPLV